MAAPIQTQWKGDEINCDMPKSNEKVPIRRAKRCVLVGFGPSTIYPSWDQIATVELSPCSEGGQGEGEAANCPPTSFPGNRTRDHRSSRPGKIPWATGSPDNILEELF